MIKDLRYVIKKILIGIGICVGLFYLKSCNVYALENEYYPIMEVQNVDSNYACRDIGTTYNFVFDDTTYEIEYRNNGIFVNNELLSNVNSNLVESQPLNSFLCRGWSVFREQPTGTIIFMLLGNQNYVNTFWVDSTINQPTSIPVRLNRLAYYKNSYVNGDMLLFRTNGVLSYHDLQLTQMTNNCNISSSQGLNCVSYAQVDYYGGTAVSDFRVGFPGDNSTANDYYYTSDFTDYTSVINSLNPQPILSDDDSILLGFDFTLSFTNFNTDNYVYKYKVGDSPTLLLTTNNYDISIRNNTTLYVMVEDLEGNVLDSQTFTITDLGTLYNGDYDITFTYNSLTNSDMYDSGTVFSDTIVRTDIDFTYFPKTNTLKYQYQYVKIGDSLDSDNWVLLNENNTSVNNKNLAVHDNGILYARILDLEDNLLFSTTFQVDSIGQVMVYDKNASKINNSFNRIKNQLNFGGPVSSLFIIPVNILQVMYGSITNTCTPYNMGSIDNHEIILPCIYPEHYLGSTLWNMIDLIFSGCMIFAIFKFLMRMYYNFVLLQNTPDIESKAGFDERSGS